MKSRGGLAAVRLAFAACVAVLASSALASAQPIVQGLQSLDATTGYSFNGYLFPISLMQASDGYFYGTTQVCTCGYGGGAIFKMTSAGVVTVLHTFPSNGAVEGVFPIGGLIQAADGNFYGTTSASGNLGGGTVYRMTPTGVITVLHTFAAGGAEGSAPYSALVEGDDGNFYGTTLFGGDLSGGGTSFPGIAFRITPAGDFTVLHSFVSATEGLYSQSPLVKMADGSFVGIREGGGSSGHGVAFRMTPGGAVTVLHAFAGGQNDGDASSYASLIAGNDGNVYGTTYDGPFGGTFFRMTPAGSVTVLHRFPAGTADGYQPNGAVLAADGSFYGTTAGGGPSGRGVIFRISTNPVVSYSIVFTFGSSQATIGSAPQGGLVQAADGSFYGVTTAGGSWDYGALFQLVLPATMTAPAPGSSISGSNTTFTWTAAPGATTYWLEVGTAVGGHELFGQDVGLATSQLVSGLPVLGSTIYVRLWTQFSGGIWRFNDYTYTAFDSKGVMTSPASGSVLGGSSVTFNWNAGTGVLQYWLEAGTSAGRGDLFEQSVGSATSQTVNGLPILGGSVYVRLWTQFAGGSWAFNDYTYTAANAKATMTSPVPGSVLGGSSVTFNWNAAPGASQYWLEIGTASGRGDVLEQSAGLAMSQTVNGLPIYGGWLYVRLWSQVNGRWLVNDYTYAASNQKAVISSPAQFTTITAPAVTFSWSPGTGATEYWLEVGTALGQHDVFGQSVGVLSSQVVSGLPNVSGSSRPLFARLWTHVADGRWLYDDYRYQVVNAGAQITAIANGSILIAPSTNFTWNAAAGATSYWLEVGSAQGGSDIFGQSVGMATSQIVGTGILGATVYVRLWTQLSSAWVYNDYFYGAFDARAFIVSPTQGSIVPGSATFTWNVGTGAASLISGYWLDVGTAPGRADVFSQFEGPATSQLVTNLPLADPVYVRLWTQFTDGTWKFVDSSYNGFGVKGSMTSPVPGSVLSGANVTFTWTSGTFTSEFWLEVGTSRGDHDIFGQSLGFATTQNVSGIPVLGGVIYVRLWTRFGSTWKYTDYSYRSAGYSAATATLTFNGAGTEGQALTTYTSSGFSVTATKGSWSVATTWGNPAPFVIMNVPIGALATGEVTVTAGGAPFSFRSADINTGIVLGSYVVTGMRNGATVFTLFNVPTTTFPPSFVQVTNPLGADMIDTLSIAVTNGRILWPTSVGVDNIVLRY